MKMELSFAQVETILKTLPIGYYAGRRVETTLDKEEETSFYSPMEDSIVVSYPIIAARMEKAPIVPDPEEAVRSMLYHEVSHAIMTNGECLGCTNINNIFEDERIETVLSDYYMNVDFKKQIRELCGNTVPTPKDAEQAFFNAVRLRCAPQSIIDEIDKIITKYGSLSQGVDDYYVWYCYQQAIEQLYEKIRKKFKTAPEQFQQQNASSAGQGSQTSPDHVEKQTQQAQTQEQTASEAQEDSINTNAPLTRDEIQRIVGACFDRTPNLRAPQAQQLANFKATAEMIINNFNKKNSGGSGINAYSGVFNPRAVVRQDYRYFERATATQGNNKFGTCHLNLFIDSSGSMYHNEKIVNGIIMVLTDIEKKNRNFTMDISFIDHEYKDCVTIRDRKYEAMGGNTIPSDMKDRFIKRQKPNTCNYNIVLFDGDALCNESLNRTEEVRRFHAFDAKQTTIITDPDNRRYFGSGFKSAKVVVTQNYTAELIDHITKALMIAFG